MTLLRKRTSARVQTAKLGPIIVIFRLLGRKSRVSGIDCPILFLMAAIEDRAVVSDDEKELLGPLKDTKEGQPSEVPDRMDSDSPVMVEKEEPEEVKVQEVQEALKVTFLRDRVLAILTS